MFFETAIQVVSVFEINNIISRQEVIHENNFVTQNVANCHLKVRKLYSDNLKKREDPKHIPSMFS